MLRDKIIRHSTRPWNSPIILVKKKEDASKKEKWRLVVDFRRLNEVTVGDSYPLPLITDILGALGKARYYTTVDLASGFHQVPLREEDRQKTAFSTRGGHFEFCNMPMGRRSRRHPSHIVFIYVFHFDNSELNCDVTYNWFVYAVGSECLSTALSRLSI